MQRCQPLTACVLSEWYLGPVEVAASQFVRFEVCSGSVFGHVCILHVEFFYVAITMAMV